MEVPRQVAAEFSPPKSLDDGTSSISDFFLENLKIKIEEVGGFQECTKLTLNWQSMQAKEA